MHIGGGGLGQAVLKGQSHGMEREAMKQGGGVAKRPVLSDNEHKKTVALIARTQRVAKTHHCCMIFNQA
jgi:hypothetical protein